ncbi:MAG: hypothetical protein VKL59_26670 [Nostocaceae cyanobacterium]|nr:hypothetical protein [Nostocaceae cyanobacterium]
MNKNSLPEDDSQPKQLTSLDLILMHQLENSVAKLFYEACDSSSQKLLSNCKWYITTYARAMTLVIKCPDQVTNWRVLQEIVKIGMGLEQFVKSAKIRVCPPENEGTPFEIRVDEISVYKDEL